VAAGAVDAGGEGDVELGLLAGGETVRPHHCRSAHSAGVAVETADVVLMRSDPLDVATAITISRGTVRKMRQNLAWAVGYNSLALPIAGGVLEPLGFVLRPEIGAISMSGSSVIVALNAVALKRLQLPEPSRED
jgi:cation transport ATPase